jgi:hypothetical protein
MPVIQSYKYLLAFSYKHYYFQTIIFCFVHTVKLRICR